MIRHTAMGDWHRHPLPQPYLYGREGSTVPVLFPSSGMVVFNSVEDSKPGDSRVVTGYQVDDFTAMGQQSSFLLNHMFTFSSQARCQH